MAEGEPLSKRGCAVHRTSRCATHVLEFPHCSCFLKASNLYESYVYDDKFHIFHPHFVANSFSNSGKRFHLNIVSLSPRVIHDHSVHCAVCELLYLERICHTLSLPTVSIRSVVLPTSLAGSISSGDMEMPSGAASGSPVNMLITKDGRAAQLALEAVGLSQL